jgi:fructokinase
MSDLQTIPTDGDSGRPLIVGEVLFDVFPDGTSVLGGAPFNVAWNLQALGLQPLLVTRVGADRPGRQVITSMEKWGLDTAGVQIDRQYPTGRAKVDLDGSGEPRFTIIPDQAYDYLDSNVDVEAILGGPAALIYHGTLIARSGTSREAVFTYRDRTVAPVFLDVNLRPPWWSEPCVARALLGARWVKLNMAELTQLDALPRGATRRDLIRAARSFKDRHALEAVIVTLGAAGAFVLWNDKLLEAAPTAVVSGRDTVGAGDGFSAVFIAGLLRGWSPETTLARALELASVVCVQRGAVSEDRALYQRLLDEWSSLK